MDLADEDAIVGPRAEDAIDDPTRESDDVAGLERRRVGARG
jgi:hypothetical protein